MCPRRGRFHGMKGRGPGRPRMPLVIEHVPPFDAFLPVHSYELTKEQLERGTEILTLGELEAIRLVDLNGMTQDEAGLVMGISRGSIWRLVNSARAKISRSILFGKPLIIRSEDIHIIKKSDEEKSA